MSAIINCLKDPHLVARIQKYYGVEVVSPLNSDLILTSNNGNISRSQLAGDDEACAFKKRLEKRVTSGTSVDDTVSESKQCVDNSIRYNGSASYEPEGDETFSSESEPESKGYIINNWMWYYLFVLGTALGDEIFYASFIPFWFWNIDGAVGRRVVLVWTVIMYIGIFSSNISCLLSAAGLCADFKYTNVLLTNQNLTGSFKCFGVEVGSS
jgi:sphingosine-1-phosphate phosphatase 1